MTAQVIPFPDRAIRPNPTEQFYQYALGQYPHWDRTDDDELMRRIFLWIAWDSWRQSPGQWTIDEPDFDVLVRRIVEHNAHR